MKLCFKAFLQVELTEIELMPVSTMNPLASKELELMLYLPTKRMIFVGKHKINLLI